MRRRPSQAQAEEEFEDEAAEAAELCRLLMDGMVYLLASYGHI
jgi:transcription initiation factor TFIID subunit 1